MTTVYESRSAPQSLDTEALDRIGSLSGIAGTVRGKPPDERRAYRQEHARPLLIRLHAWHTTTLETLSRKSDRSRAILYALNRCDALTHYRDDGHLEIDNLPVERTRGEWPLAAATICWLDRCGEPKRCSPYFEPRNIVSKF